MATPRTTRTTVRYRKVATRMWGDERFRQLSAPKPNGQTLWVYLLTGPHTTAIPGLFSAGESSLAEAIGWPQAAFRRCFTEIVDQGMALADWKARVIWIPKAVLYNAPESPNVIKAWRAASDQIPECDLKRRGLKQLEAFLQGFGEGFRQAFRQAFSQVSAEGSVESGAVAVAVTPPSPPGKASGKASHNGRLDPAIPYAQRTDRQIWTADGYPRAAFRTDCPDQAWRLRCVSPAFIEAHPEWRGKLPDGPRGTCPEHRAKAAYPWP